MLGRLYLPREALDAAGIAAADPAIAIPDPRFGDAWLAVALMAETRYVHADTLLPAARRRDVRPALAMLAVYRALLGRLMSRGWRRGAPLAVVPPWQRWTVAARVMAFGS
jgi:phytoene synthase